MSRTVHYNVYERCHSYSRSFTWCCPLMNSCSSRMFFEEDNWRSTHPSARNRPTVSTPRARPLPLSPPLPLTPSPPSWPPVWKTKAKERGGVVEFLLFLLLVAVVDIFSLLCITLDSYCNCVLSLTIITSGRQSASTGGRSVSPSLTDFRFAGGISADGSDYRPSPEPSLIRKAKTTLGK